MLSTVTQGDWPVHYSHSKCHRQGDGGKCRTGYRGEEASQRGTPPSSGLSCPFPVGLSEGNIFPTTSPQLLIPELALHFKEEENLTEKPISWRWRCPSLKDRVAARELRVGTVLRYLQQLPAPWSTASQCADGGPVTSPLHPFDRAVPTSKGTHFKVQFSTFTRLSACDPQKSSGLLSTCLCPVCVLL